MRDYQVELAAIRADVVKAAKEAEQQKAVAAAAAEQKKISDQAIADKKAAQAREAAAAKKQADMKAAGAAADAKTALETPNFYDVLGVTKDVSEDDLKSAYKKKCLQWHPDRHHTEEAKAEADTRFKVNVVRMYIYKYPFI